MKQAAAYLGKETKKTILIGKNVRDIGISMEVLESSSDKLILDGWSLDAFGSRRRCGLGIAKDIYKTELVEIDAGVYATKRLKDLLNTKLRPDLSFGISGRVRF